eukprot:192963_1
MAHRSEDESESKHESETLVGATNTALSRYYARLDKPYDNNLRDYCEESGFDDDDTFRDEMNTGSHDCLIVEFDETFPFEEEPKGDLAKKEIIYRIIRLCMDYPQMTFSAKLPNFRTMGDDLFKLLKKEDLKNILDKYEQQCPVFVDSDWNRDGGLLQILAIGDRHQFDYMLHLVDDYSRWRIKVKDNKTIKGTTQEWCEWEGHAHFSKFEKMTIDYNARAKCAVDGFNHRACNMLQLDPMSKIDDDLARIIYYIEDAANWIGNLIHDKSRFNPKGLCPFQVDFCIASGAPIKDENLVEKGLEAIKTNRNKPDVEHKFSDDEEETDDFIDYVGNIEENLKNRKIKYAKCKYSEVDDQKETRVLGELYNRFLKDNDLRANDENTFQYLHKKRLIAMVDRRTSKDDPKARDDIYMFESPLGGRRIPDDAVPEWYINSSATCLIPGQRPQDDLGAKHHFKGGLLTLSFHVKQENEIKCYLFWNGQMIRFMPNDIKTVLPCIINMKNDPDYIKENKTELGVRIRNMERSFFDEGFTRFCCGL